MWQQTAGFRLILVSLVFTLLAAGSLTFSSVAPASANQEADAPQTGLYDEADVLSDDEEERIASRISDVEAAGAPTVVHLRLRDSEPDQTVRDGQQLMEDWSLESSPGARDGFVMFFNLKPDDPNRGDLGLVAGETHFDGGALPQSELDRIRDEMINLLSDDRMADAIALGLELTAERLELGPPEPTAVERVTDQVAGEPLSAWNAIAVLAAGALGFFGIRIWQNRPRPPRMMTYTSTAPPDELHPALAGALVDGRVNHTHIEATIIELARRGALQFGPDPDEDEKAQLRMLDRSGAQYEFETRLLDIINREGTDGELTQDEVAKTYSEWSGVQDLLRTELQRQGWYDPDARARRLPLYLYGVIALVLSGLGFLALAILEEPWPLIGAVLLLILGFALIVLGMSYPSTSLEGEREAMSWRAYREGLKKVNERDYREIDFDAAFPYIVAFSLVSQFKDNLEQASEAGYAPTWFAFDRLHHQHAYPHNTWFVYWIAFHHSMSPQSTSAGGGAPGGAAGGSGGSGGSF